MTEVSHAYTPFDVDRIFVDAMNRGDIEQVMALYSDQTVFVQAPGKAVVTGLPNLRQVIGEFLATEPDMRVELKQFVQADDVAFFTVRWHLKGKDADGKPIEMSAYDGNVLKRQPDGRWVTVIDNPFHSEHIGLS